MDKIEATETKSPFRILLATHTSMPYRPPPARPSALQTPTIFGGNTNGPASKINRKDSQNRGEMIG